MRIWLLNPGPARALGRGCRATPRLRSAILMALLAVLAGSPAHAATNDGNKPYDDRLYRLSEILGAVHYLRELCGADEGQLWRDRMGQLIQSEGSTPLRRFVHAVTSGTFTSGITAS